MNTIKLNNKTMKMNLLNFKKQTTYFLSAIFCFALLASCSSDDDGGNVEEPNEEEVITDVTITFVNDADASDTVELKSVDADGEEGPLAPIKTVTGNFTAGETYTATLDIYNSIEDEDITVEIKELLWNECYQSMKRMTCMINIYTHNLIESNRLSNVTGKRSELIRKRKRAPLYSDVYALPG